MKGRSQGRAYPLAVARNWAEQPEIESLTSTNNASGQDVAARSDTERCIACGRVPVEPVLCIDEVCCAGCAGRCGHCGAAVPPGDEQCWDCAITVVEAVAS
ncbi:Uncharacterised protein [Mycobacteroides abscessus subsp. abscessus]|nr:Uncharacterised protein [Mycobacteroides abscessus subsp. abscessus]